MADLNDLYQGVIDGNAKKARSLSQEAMAEGTAPGKVLTEALIPAMAEVGRRMKEGEYYVPEVLISARAMYAALGVLRPMLAETGAKPAGVVVAGTVKGDLHDIGKNLVCMMLEGTGYEVHDLGTDVPPGRFVEAIQQNQANIVALSALLTTTMPSMKSTIDAIKEAGLRDRVKILIGGAPVTQRYASEIGADGYAPDAASAVDKAHEVAV